jgi:hypothetical protein
MPVTRNGVATRNPQRRGHPQPETVIILPVL